MKIVVLSDSQKSPKKLTDGQSLMEKTVPMILNWMNRGQTEVEDLVSLHTTLSDCLSKGGSIPKSQSNELKSDGRM
jgi:hypothetical protein